MEKGGQKVEVGKFDVKKREKVPLYSVLHLKKYCSGENKFSLRSSLVNGLNVI